ncbi:hypothetical protein DHEL01_v201667 [Diaporthe helianthi]|uniref:Uncharacterized protein n=1 Tax=Diaporthe helianthi TaxID=158607 RepID=A0A2P5IBQ2_DIAHE|nr:hypothetical protein DHEL01_v201667 [Diaporthe helianthi]
MRLRQEPSTRQNQVPLQFSTGPALFPTDLSEVSAEDRYNSHETVVYFGKEAAMAQVHLSVNGHHRSPGQPVAHLVTTKAPKLLHLRKARSQIGPKKDRANFKRQTLHVFQGYDDETVSQFTRHTMIRTW